MPAIINLPLPPSQTSLDHITCIRTPSPNDTRTRQRHAIMSRAHSKGHFIDSHTQLVPHNNDVTEIITFKA